MSAWKPCASVMLCALIFTACSDMGVPLPFVDDKKNENEEFTLRAKVRDFKEGNGTDNSNTHPHFNQTTWTCDAGSMGSSVEASLDMGGSSDPKFPGDYRTPKLAADLPATLARCFNPADRFSDWFEDKDTEVNRPFLITMRWGKTGDGNWLFRQDKFFPLDEPAGYTPAKSGIPGPFGRLQTGSKDDVDLTQHVYGFTMEAHGQFKYSEGKGQTITVKGDDDLWIFVDGKRALDLGGTHPAQNGTVEMDKLGLTNGSTYALDIFFAERSVASSNLMLETNFVISSIK